MSAAQRPANPFAPRAPAPGQATPVLQGTTTTTPPNAADAPQPPPASVAAVNFVPPIKPVDFPPPPPAFAPPPVIKPVNFPPPSAFVPGNAQPPKPAELSPPATMELPLHSPISKSPPTKEETNAAAEKATKTDEEHKDGGGAGGMFGWIAGSKLLKDVADKAKVGLDTVLTSLDPGMHEVVDKERGDVEDRIDWAEIYVATRSADVAEAVRDGWRKCFRHVTVVALPIPGADAPQLVTGRGAARAACRAALARLEASKLVAQPLPLVVAADYLEQTDEGNWESATLFILRWKDTVELSAPTQPLPVEQKIVDYLKQRSLAARCPIDTFPISVAEAAKEVHSTVVSTTSFDSSFLPPYASLEYQTAAAALLAQLFRQAYREYKRQKRTTTAAAGAQKTAQDVPNEKA